MIQHPFGTLQIPLRYMIQHPFGTFMFSKLIVNSFIFISTIVNKNIFIRMETVVTKEQMRYMQYKP